MKKLLLIISVILLCSCQQNDWYKNGHIDVNDSCTFIVNDSIKIIAEETILNDLRYCVFVNGLESRACTYHSVFDNKRKLIEYLQWDYEYPIKIEPRKKSNYNDCFKY